MQQFQIPDVKSVASQMTPVPPTPKKPASMRVPRATQFAGRPGDPEEPLQTVEMQRLLHAGRCNGHYGLMEAIVQIARERPTTGPKPGHNSWQEILNDWESNEPLWPGLIYSIPLYDTSRCPVPAVD